MIKFLLHFGFLVAGVALVARRGERFYWITLGAFCGGLAVNGLYGLTQLAYAETTGGNFDELFVQPITGGDSKINIYGAIGGQNVYRVNALTGDPNHLGIEISVAILVLLPIYLRMEKGNPWRLRILALLAFLAIVQLATLSRSGILGLLCGLLVLVVPYRRLLLTARFLVPLGILVAGVLVFINQRGEFFEQVFRSRFSTAGAGSSTHFVVYSFIPDVLAMHPLFGLGLNNFSVYYQFVTGRDNFGPHSFYVALFVETGLVGALLFGVFLVYLFRRCGATRRIGRALADLGDPVAVRVRPLGWGLTAALVATLVSNAFYLTMTFYYFYVVALLIIAPPAVFGRRLDRAP
jgi:O-antigen ligase